MLMLRLFDFAIRSVCEPMSLKHKGSKDRRVKDRMGRNSKPPLNL